MIVFLNSVNIIRNCDLDVGLMLSSKLLLNTYFCKRRTNNLTCEEPSRLCLHRNPGDDESETLAFSLKVFNIALENALLCQVDLNSQFEGTTWGQNGSCLLVTGEVRQLVSNQRLKLPETFLTGHKKCW